MRRSNLLLKEATVPNSSRGKENSKIFCDDCAGELQEGNGIVALASRQNGEFCWHVEYVKCNRHEIKLKEEFSKDNSELVVTGRVGRCFDQASQSSWQVLINPQIKAISPKGTIEAHPLPGQIWMRATELPITASKIGDDGYSANHQFSEQTELDKKDPQFTDQPPEEVNQL